MLIKNAGMLLGPGLEFVQPRWITINNGTFTRIGSGPVDHDDDTFDAEGLLAIPGLINAHTHTADSIAKDVAAGLGFNESIHPVYGLKRKILDESRQEHVATYMRASALSMMRKGTTTFADFREGGTDGMTLFRNALAGLDIHALGLGRVEYYVDSVKSNKDLPEDARREAELVIRASDGFGISGANEYSDSTLQYLASVATSHNKLLGIHAAEAQESCEYSMKNFGRNEVSRIVSCMTPNFMVHMTNASEDDVKLVSSKKIGIVICPRANGVLGVGVPRIAMMLRHNCTIAVGTDNVMLNSPDLFRELDYIWKASRALEKEFVAAKELLKMVTVNPARMLRLNKLGYIDEGMTADVVFIDTHSLDLEPMHDPHASILHRVSESSIRAVMIGGKFVHGSL